MKALEILINKLREYDKQYRAPKTISTKDLTDLIQESLDEAKNNS